MTATVDAGLRQSRETTVLAHLDAEKHRDLDATLATFKVGAARLELPGGEVADGPAKVADTYRVLFHAFPDLSTPDLEPGSLCHHGDLVIAEIRLQGTHMGTFRGLPPTGRRIDMPLVAIFEFDGPDLLCERVYLGSPHSVHPARCRTGPEHASRQAHDSTQPPGNARSRDNSGAQARPKIDPYSDAVCGDSWWTP